MNAIAALLVVVALAGGAALASCSDGEPQSPMESVPFDATIWKDANKVRDERRMAMYDDLTKHYPLTGRDAAYVLELLGPPTTETTRSSIVVWEYRLGPEPGVPSIDSLWLQVIFERTNMVVEQVSRVTD